MHTSYNILTPWSCLLEIPPVPQLLRNSPAFYGIQRFCRVHKSPSLVSILSYINSVLTSHPISQRSILTSSSHQRLSLPSGLFPPAFCLLQSYGKGICKVKLSLYRPWRPLGLWEVEAPTFSDVRHIDGGKVVSPTRRPPLSPGNFLALISVRGWVDPRVMARLEELGQLKI
jgi:hypothetical protein